MDKYIDYFLNYLQTEKDAANTTIHKYRADLERLFEYLKVTDINEISQNNLRDYLNYIRQIYNYTSSSIANKINILHHFFRFLHASGYISSNPAILIRSTRKKVKIPKVLNEIELEKLLKATDHNTDTRFKKYALGFNTFYVSRNHIINSNKDISVFLNEFNKYLKICIGAIAVLRLTIDPFPILLVDEEIYLRTGDLMTEAYSEDFTEKYIGKKYLTDYKKTEVYKNFHKGIMHEEEKLPCVADVVKNQYVDREKIDIILKQKHLLSRMDLIAVLIFYFCNDIAKIYFYDGLGFYFSSIKSVRKGYGYDSRVLLKIKESNKYLNNPYDEAFLTYLKICKEDFFIEHNKKLNKNEIKRIIKSIDDFMNT